MRRVNKLWKWIRPSKISSNSYLTLYQLHNIRGLSHTMSQDGRKTPQGLRNHSLSECSSDQLPSYVVHLSTAVEPIEQAAWLDPCQTSSRGGLWIKAPEDELPSFSLWFWNPEWLEAQQLSIWLPSLTRLTIQILPFLASLLKWSQWRGIFEANSDYKMFVNWSSTVLSVP